MTPEMNNILFKLIRYSGLPAIFRLLIQRKKVTILMLHDIGPEKARMAFTFLKKHYNIIPLQQYITAVQTGRPLPPRAVILTFDDGHVGNYQLLPILREMHIPVTIFLCSDIVGTHRHFWFKHSHEVAPVCQQMKTLPDEQRLTALAAYGYDKTMEYTDIQALTHAQIEEMRPWVDFQAHTCFHPILTRCDDETSRAEITLSKQHLERDFALSINAFAYPNGDYSDREIQYLKDAGYTCAITVDYGFNDLHSDMYRLKRISVNDGRTMDELVVKASGAYGFMKNIMRRP